MIQYCLFGFNIIFMISCTFARFCPTRNYLEQDEINIVFSQSKSPIVLISFKSSSLDNCVTTCCQKTKCAVAVFSKEAGKCSLIDCGRNTELCSFVRDARFQLALNLHVFNYVPDEQLNICDDENDCDEFSFCDPRLGVCICKSSFSYQSGICNTDLQCTLNDDCKYRYGACLQGFCKCKPGYQLSIYENRKHCVLEMVAQTKPPLPKIHLMKHRTMHKEAVHTTVNDEKEFSEVNSSSNDTITFQHYDSVVQIHVAISSLVLSLLLFIVLFVFLSIRIIKQTRRHLMMHNIRNSSFKKEEKDYLINGMYL